MAPSPHTEDYYMVLEEGQTETTEQITKSYKRLALKLHPDHNAKRDATEAFRLHRRAYETLKDESERRAYGLEYPSIRRKHTFPSDPQKSCPPYIPTWQSGALSESAQIAALQRSEEARASGWRNQKMAVDLSISELQRSILRLEQDIKDLNGISAAEAATEAQKNSWATWVLSPLYKKTEDNIEMKEHKDRKRQERRIEKDMNERRLEQKKAELRKEEILLNKAKTDIDTENVSDIASKRELQARICARVRACPKCQAAMRQGRQRTALRTNSRASRWGRTLSPYDDCGEW